MVSRIAFVCLAVCLASCAAGNSKREPSLDASDVDSSNVPRDTRPATGQDAGGAESPPRTPDGSSPGTPDGNVIGADAPPIDSTAGDNRVADASVGGDTAPPPADGSSSDRFVPMPTGRTFVYVAGTNIKAFELNMTTGVLTSQGTGVNSGYSIFAAADGVRRRAYVSTETSMIGAYSLNATTGRLAHVSTSALVAGATFLTIHKSGKWLFTPHYGSGLVAVYPIASNGAIQGVSDMKTAGSRAHNAQTDPSGNFLFVPCVGSNHIAQYRLNVDTGKLTANSVARPDKDGVGPRHIAFHPTKPFAYVQNETLPSMSVYRFDQATGKLTFIHTVSTWPVAVTAGAGAHVEVHPSGKLAFGSIRFSGGGIGVMSIDEETGRLTFRSRETAAGGTDYFTLERSGKFMVATTGKEVLVLDIDPTSGKLTRKTSRDEGYAQGIAVATVD